MNENFSCTAYGHDDFLEARHKNNQFNLYLCMKLNRKLDVSTQVRPN